MGQYFKAVNLDKCEVVCPWCLGGGDKLWEWAANPGGAIFTLLLRKSSATGGGDYFDPLSPADREIHLDSGGPEDTGESLRKALVQLASVEGRPVAPDVGSVVGRWAGDRVVLVGDYDESKIWDELPAYRNITKELVETWKRFIDLPDMKLTFNAMCSCQTVEAS